jgi:hypothetical protein
VYCIHGGVIVWLLNKLSEEEREKFKRFETECIEEDPEYTETWYCGVCECGIGDQYILMEHILTHLGIYWIPWIAPNYKKLKEDDYGFLRFAYNPCSFKENR